jgi:dipeptidyl aminopeptidase/acylaminoacyl peptidase
VDEFGGGDVIKIIEIASKLPYVDEKRIGVVGVSRGVMSYLVSKHSDTAKAYVAVFAPVDLLAELNFRPKMYNVFNGLIGD